MGAVAAGIAGVALIGGGTAAGILGGKQYPQYQPVSFGQQQQQAVQNNLKTLPGAEQLGSQVNQWNASQLSELLNQALPYYGEVSEAALGNINAELKGEVPTDVQQQIQDSAAASSLTGGFGGTGLAGNLTARDLGLTSLSLTGRGLSSAQSWIQQSASMLDPRSFDLTSMFVTPQQQAAFTAGQANLLQQNKMGWYGIPSGVQQIGSAMSSVGGMLLGGAMGSGGGGGGGMSMMGGMMGGGGGGGSSSQLINSSNSLAIQDSENYENMLWQSSLMPNVSSDADYISTGI